MDDFAAPVEDRWFEDYREGAVYEYGYLAVTEAAILEFARQFDPQPIHLPARLHQGGDRLVRR